MLACCLCLGSLGAARAQEDLFPPGETDVDFGDGTPGSDNPESGFEAGIPRSGLPFETLFTDPSDPPGGGNVPLEEDRHFGSHFADPSDPIPTPSPSLVPGRLVFDATGDGLTGELGTSMSYNSNFFEDPVESESGLMSTSDLSLHYRRGGQQAMGPFFGLDLNLAYYEFLDEALNEGREPFEYDLSGYVGAKGAKSSVTLSGSFTQNNGDSISQQRFERETLGRSSKNYAVNLNARRTLARDTLEAGLGLRLQDFGEDETGTLTDLSQWDGILAWNHKPRTTPKTDFRLGVGFGNSEQQGGVEQKNVSPSLGWTYRYSPKTVFFGSVGYDFRQSTSTLYATTTTTTITTPPPVVVPAPAPLPPGAVAPPAPMPVTTTTSATASSTTKPAGATSVTTTGADGSTTTVTTATTSTEQSFEQTAPTYDLGFTWSPTETVRFGMSVSRSSSASALEGQSSSDTQRFNVTGTKQFPRGYFATADYSLEDSGYTTSSGVEVTGSVDGRPEIYHRFGLTCGRQFELRARLTLSASVFYQVNLGRGSDSLTDFDQAIAGIRFGLAF